MNSDGMYYATPLSLERRYGLDDLEVEGDTYAKGVVFAGIVVGFWPCGCHCCDVTAVIESTHITEVYVEFFCGIDAHTSTNHVVGKAV